MKTSLDQLLSETAGTYSPPLSVIVTYCLLLKDHINVKHTTFRFRFNWVI